MPLLSDLSHKISTDYGVYLEDVGHSLRGLFIIDDKQVLRQITLNDLVFYYAYGSAFFALLNVYLMFFK